MKPLVIVPTYNEAANIRRLVPLLLQLPHRPDILVVDDNSPDGTGQIVRDFSKDTQRVHLLAREKKEGLGKAYLAGFAWALEKDYDPICTMDADLSHRPSDLVTLTKAVQTGETDLAIGSKYVAGGNVDGWSAGRLFLSRGANLLARFLLSLKPRDVTAGFKCYRRQFLASIKPGEIIAPGYAFQVEMILRAKQGGERIKEYPITFQDRTQGRSKVSQDEFLRSATSLLRLFLRRRGARQAGKFGLVGFVNFAIDLGFTNLGVHVLDLAPTIAGYLGVLVATANSFFLNRAWTFRIHDGPLHGQASRFLIVSGILALIHSVIYTILLTSFDVWFNLAKLITIALVGLMNFAGTKYFVFSLSERDKNQSRGTSHP